MTDDTIWRVDPMTKPVTSVALMQLYERGLFGLTDPLARYIPEWGDLKVGELGPEGSTAWWTRRDRCRSSTPSPT